MLYDYYKYFINYLILLYGGSYKIEGTILFIYCGSDEFKVNLLDGSRFDKYTFFHKNYKANHGHFHKQLECRDLEYGLFRCFTHEFNYRYEITSNPEDYKRFAKDVLKYKILSIDKEGENNE
jgi:hypothetical protein